jgi:uncharacterized protein YjbI with pentapeptide repeats
MSRMVTIAVFIQLLSILVANAASGDLPKEVKAEEILKKIENGEPIDYDRVTVVGDLNLSNSTLPRDQDGKIHVNANVKIAHSTIEGSIDFTNSIISRTIDFTGTAFIRDALFNEAQFDGGAIFQGSSFDEDASFDDAIFSVEANFNNAKFNGGSSFYNARFGGDVGFFGSNFIGDSIFNKAKFDGGAHFDGTEFNSYANFVGAEFQGDTSFYQTEFRWNANFAEARFDGIVYFKGAKFGKLVSFAGAQFTRYTSFETVQFDEEADFSDVQFQDSYFWGAKYGGKLTLNGTQFTIMQIEWDSIKDHLVYNDASYLSLIKNFDSLGHYADSDNCYYQYRKEKQDRETILGSKILDVSALVTCGYGVRPLNTFFLSVLVVIIFAIIYWIGKAVPESVYEDLTTRYIGTQLQAISTSIYFSALAFVTAHASIELRPYGYWKYMVLLEHILGWLLMTLFLVTLGRVMIR